MRTIILTDFSSCARNAAEYAIQLLGKDKQFILLNTFKVDILGNSGLSYEDLRQHSQDSHKRERDRLCKQFGMYENQFRLESIEGRVNFLNERLLDELEANLVVMGTEGVSEEEKYIGSTHAGEVVTRLKRNVLVIPSNARFGRLEKVLLATDFQEVNNKVDLDAYQSMVQGTKTHILYIYPNGETELSEHQAAEKSLLEQAMRNEAVIFEERRNHKIDEEVRKYVRDHQMEMVVVIPKHNNFFDRIFHFSVTRKLAQTSPVPVLALHGKTE